ncbi:MAG TPA: SLBB domain-containing protein [Candidatus Deferrimicrobiaceae bacterium]
MLLFGPAMPLRAEDNPDAGVTPEMIDEARQVIQSGAEIPPDAKQFLEAHPELKEQLIQGAKKKADEDNKGKDKTSSKTGAVPPNANAVSVNPPPLPSYDWRNSVYLAGLFGKRLGDNEAKSVVHFGHDLFAPKPGGAAVLEDMPVSPSFVVGPGDEIVVRTWGRLEGTSRLTVDRDGKIFYPKLGSMHVAGKTFGELKSYLRAKIGTMAQVSADVSLGDMKASRVSVVGEVRSPGWYNVSSFHTALQALYLAGGLKDIGSFRRVELRRGGRLLTTIDLYDFLLHGENSGDIRLRQGDTIFVPVVGRLVAVAGDVRRPAIYELAPEKSLAEVVAMAGGFAPSAFTQRVQVERLEGNTARTVLDTDASTIAKGGSAFDLADGDVVRVLPILDAEKNVVRLEGNVARPGKYEAKKGMTVGGLLPDEKTFLPETDFDYALLTRLVPPDQHKEMIPVNLRAIVLERKKEADIALQGGDTLKVYPRGAFRDGRKASISGEVRMARDLVPAPVTDNQATLGKVAGEARPEDNVLSFDVPEGARVSDLVKLAGGLSRTALLTRAELIRVDAGRNFTTVYVDLGKALSGDPQADLLLQDEDHLRVHSVYEARYKKSVTASGELNGPGEYLMTDGMRLSDLLFKAGGFKESAYGKEAELVRREISPDGTLVATQTIVVSPSKAIAGDPASDVTLKENDLLVVRAMPDWSTRQQVTLAGEVRFPGIYTVRKGERLSSVVARAGGFTGDAYFRAGQFSRESTRASQQAAIDKLIEELELEIAQKAQESGAAIDKEDLDSNRALLAARRSLIAQLKKAKATGRVIIGLPDDGRIAGSTADILLEDGDRLEVPRKMNVVNVVGRVYNPTGVVFDPGTPTVGHYLRLVGGPTETADRDHIFLLRADGTVATGETSRSGGFFVFGDRGVQSAKVAPGDSIVVPEKLVQTRLMKDIKDITQIMMQIAVTAGVLLRL